MLLYSSTSGKMISQALHSRREIVRQMSYFTGQSTGLWRMLDGNFSI